MSDQEQQEEESAAPPASTDGDAVDAAMKGIPGLAESMESQPAARTGSDAMEEVVQEEPEPESLKAPRPQVEDSETVQQARKQLGL